jgi:hypothetical protein
VHFAVCHLETLQEKEEAVGFGNPPNREWTFYDQHPRRFKIIGGAQCRKHGLNAPISRSLLESQAEWRPISTMDDCGFRDAAGMRPEKRK